MAQQDQSEIFGTASNIPWAGWHLESGKCNYYKGICFIENFLHGMNEEENYEMNEEDNYEMNEDWVLTTFRSVHF